jgi:hypothetical protein
MTVVMPRSVFDPGVPPELHRREKTRAGYHLNATATGIRDECVRPRDAEVGGSER